MNTTTIILLASFVIIIILLVIAFIIRESRFKEQIKAAGHDKCYQHKDDHISLK